MARIPDEEIERVKREVDLVALVRSKGIDLKKQGKDFAARCPFHKEETPSFIITPDKNLFHCFGCGKAGSNIDFIMSYDAVSFRHAYELLANADARLLFTASDPLKCSSARKLQPPVAFDADDYTVMRQVVDFYHDHLKQSPTAHDAREYLKKRGITDEAIDHFHIGFAERTLGLHLPFSRTKEGGKIRAQLKKLGIIKQESGSEHFTGHVVFPIFKNGNITEIYGRKILKDSKFKHRYLPGPHVGIFNAECLLQSRTIILCESIIDALSFWCAGIRNVTCTYGNEGFTDELLQALIDHKSERIYLAYDRDESGERAADRDAKKLCDLGMECLRILFPQGMDANQVARRKNADLQGLIHSAEWLGGKPKITPAAKIEESSLADTSLFSLAANSLAAAVPTFEETVLPDPAPEPKPEPAAKKESPSPAAEPPKAPPELAGLRQVGEDLFFEPGDRVYRIRGFSRKTIAGDMKINLRLTRGDLYYVNVFDLYQSKLRAQFIEEAARETLLERELIKRDLGKLLLKLEEMQTEPEATSETASPVLEPEELKAAMDLLKSPNLLDRILEDLQFSMGGEKINSLTGYLGMVSRKLDRPLAIIIQSTSAAGKTSLMEAILAMMPEEEKIKYSAMTGQSLYYLGEKNLKHKVLAIVEEEGAEKASYALKLLQSEGELSIASTSKDQNGRMRTEEYRVEGPVMIILTTTAVDIDEELLNRCVILTVDESREQTERIHKFQREAQTLEGLRRRLQREQILTLHRNAQRLLKSIQVLNPYAPRLTFLSDRTRTRRDHMKYLTLIQTIALLHQYQRPIQELGGKEYIAVEPRDILAANAIAHEILGRTLDELPPQTRKLLAEIDAFIRKLCREKGIERKQCWVTRRQIREYTGSNNTQLKVHLDRLVDLEYLAKHSGKNGQTYVYELTFDGDPETNKAQLPGLITLEALLHDDLFTQIDPNLAGLNGHLTGQKGHLTGQNANLTPTLRPPFGDLTATLRDEQTPANRDKTRGSQPIDPKTPQNRTSPQKNYELSQR